jgi:tRNA pseudouridine38-40 synthase
LKLILEYDGTDFVGWQVQPNGRSVQAVVEEALRKLLDTRVNVAAAGRTDSGVHAEGQVASFVTDRHLPLKAYVQGLNSELPDDVSVVSAEEVPVEFDPRRWALGKRYRYRISNRPARSALWRRTHWQVFQPLDFPAMVEAAAHLIGKHDFSAFRASDCEATNPVREVRNVMVHLGERGAIEIEVEGTAFLKHMVRNFAGALVEVGRRKRPAGWIAEVLASKDRTLAGPTAPAHGLTLVEVLYGEGRPAHVSPDSADDE